MKNLLLIFLSFFAGAAILIQSSLSGQLAKQIGSPYLSSLALYFMSTIFMGIIIMAFRVPLPTAESCGKVPTHLWFIGSMCSVIGLTLVYWLMPILGVSKVLAGIVAGQVIMATFVSHYGLFEMPVVEINIERIFGVLFLIIGVILINGGFFSERIK
ncbi:DMT family transporter [Bacteriovorax sp. DB6_IX]|uniref:DMT family transporter n=1 Tax=Bacteriovorax sp. DB6_IX TaxID=1353530 RepID=UPI00038A2729|nr:DMT family transporter [Bacteriovorax sp. DB6_IX]EQC50847.1 PF04657 family protein [Bacteriovorax sp. DB6_IX]